MLRRRPVVVRREPGLFSTMAGTAAAAGTATVAAKGISGALERDAAAHAVPEQQQTETAAQHAPAEQMPRGGYPPQPASAPPPAPEPAPPVTPPQDRIAQLQRLGELKEAGMLTEEEFQSQKERILSG